MKLSASQEPLDSIHDTKLTRFTNRIGFSPYHWEASASPLLPRLQLGQLVGDGCKCPRALDNGLAPGKVGNCSFGEPKHYIYIEGWWRCWGDGRNFVTCLCGSLGWETPSYIANLDLRRV